jgi:hypothetical protein
MTVFSREQEVRATFSLLVTIFIIFIAIGIGWAGSPVWVGLLVIAFAFAIPFIRILIEQE